MCIGAGFIRKGGRKRRVLMMKFLGRSIWTGVESEHTTFIPHNYVMYVDTIHNYIGDACGEGRIPYLDPTHMKCIVVGATTWSVIQKIYAAPEAAANTKLISFLFMTVLLDRRYMYIMPPLKSKLLHNTLLCHDTVQM